MHVNKLLAGSTILLLSLVHAYPTAADNQVIVPRDDDNHGTGGFHGRIKNLVTFGDSYTDENRLGYFINHNGTAPPVGTILPESTSTSTGGRTWARVVSQLTGVTLYNYAVSGAVCSNDVTPRFFSSINADFPAVQQYEIPAFTADQHVFKLNFKETVFSIWIGTNDLGGDALISHSELPGTGLTNFTDCVFDSLHSLYNLGARNFVLQNIAPLQFAPLYADAAHGGSPGPSNFWRTKGDNITEISQDMRDLVQAVNQIWDFQAPFAVENELKGANLAVFDSYGLMLDIYNNPANYLNGTPPLNTTGFNVHCNVDGSVCTDYRIDSRDSFFWYDPLHPSEQVERIIAKEFTKTIEGKSKWATFW